MLRYLRYLLIAVLLLVLLTMAIANRTVVPVRFLPEDVGALFGVTWQMELPLFLVSLGGVVMGVLIWVLAKFLRQLLRRFARAIPR